mgnify:CR=1 FL=1
MKPVANTTAIILAGGQSSRMGEDKGLMNLEGQPMIQYIIDSVKQIASNIIIIANDKAYEQFGFEVHEDLVKEKGPLVGIVTGLSASKTELNWIISCDAPYVSKDLLLDLMNKLNEFEAVVPEKEEKKHPLIGAYKKSTLPVFKQALALNHLKIMTVISQLHVLFMDANNFDVLTFRNLNSKKDL